MRNVFFTGAVGIVLMLSTGAQAAERGTPDEAKALAEKAIAHIKTVGAAKAFDEFSTPGGPFHDRDLYVFCYDSNRKMVAHGLNRALVGKDLAGKDADGNDIAAQMIKIGEEGGWVEYKWSNPQTKKIEAKATYIKKVGSDSCGVGVYK
ncbi:MAG TPA: cache domain-containing protein [Azospirillaceae bacterium]|nr:cache domain-containing protein [Azospirillaceae bacterium]